MCHIGSTVGALLSHSGQTDQNGATLQRQKRRSVSNGHHSVRRQTVPFRMGHLPGSLKPVRSEMGTIRSVPNVSHRRNFASSVEKRPLISQGRGVVSPQRRLMGSEFGRSTSREPAALRLLLINRRLPARCRGSPLNRPRPAGPGNPGPGSDARPSRSPPATSRSPRRYSWR